MKKETASRMNASSKIQDNNIPEFASLIRTKLCGFDLQSPTMLASGVLGISFDLFPRIIKSGCGAIVTKSIGLERREGYKNPTMAATDCGYLNAIGLANPGVEEFRSELDEFNLLKFPLVVSIFADSAENFALLARKLDQFDFSAFELNLSCPHVKEVGSEMGSDAKRAAEVVRSVKNSTRKPVFAKMPATIVDVPLWSRNVEEAGADAIVAINTVRAMRIDIQSRKPILSNKFGGLSGAALRPIAMRVVYEIYESVQKIPIIGVGGVTNWRDAVEFFLAGATCIQIGSAMATSFLSTFENVNTGVTKYLQESGFTSVKEIVGIAHD